MVDTHAHLSKRFFTGNIDELIKQCKTLGLTAIILASSNLEESSQSVELAKKYPGFLYASVGIHPQNTNPECHLSIREMKFSRKI